MHPTDYVSVVYNTQDRPLTSYPNQLTTYLSQRFSLQKNQTLLDVGCGRGEFLQGFMQCGLDVYGIDQSLQAKYLYPNVNITIADLNQYVLPYADNQFDVVFSKSVVEHFYYPERLFAEFKRVLKPQGRLITLTPDWESTYHFFYEDFTHRTPFTKTSLQDLQSMLGFENIHTEKFLQLPFAWKNTWNKSLLKSLGYLLPKCSKSWGKTLRFSKELMLLSHSQKPAEQANV